MLETIVHPKLVKQKLEMRPVFMLFKRLLAILFPSPSKADMEEIEARFKRAFIN
jgi:hypothetical protein